MRNGKIHNKMFYLREYFGKRQKKFLSDNYYPF